jgi:hypothetical protein
MVTSMKQMRKLIATVFLVALLIATQLSTLLMGLCIQTPPCIAWDRIRPSCRRSCCNPESEGCSTARYESGRLSYTPCGLTPRSNSIPTDCRSQRYGACPGGDCCSSDESKPPKLHDLTTNCNHSHPRRSEQL